MSQEFSAPTANSLSGVITNPKVRAVIYGAFVVLLVIAGAVAAAYLSLGVAYPSWLIGAQAVLTFLGIPVGSLALANTKAS